MKKWGIIILLSLSVQIAFSQTVNDALKAGDQSLRDRYSLMKTKSQSFQDYKVIKEYVIDGMWKIIQDSIKVKDGKLQASRANVANLEKQLASAKASLKQKEQSMNDIVYDSTHITVMGIDFTKSSFITFFAIVTGVMLLIVGLIAARLKLMQSSMKESSDSFNRINTEYEEYKRKALDKQTKLSRELQDERNKLASIRSN